MFAISRPTGKSDAEVLASLIASANPGDLLGYDALSEALSFPGRAYDVRSVQSAVCRAERKLATEHRRALINVRGQGYRIALASEHQLIAGRKKDRASVMLRRGLQTLQHVDWDAMDANTRKAHEGQLMVMGALHSAVQGLDDRLSKIEEAIKNRNGK